MVIIEYWNFKIFYNYNKKIAIDKYEFYSRIKKFYNRVRLSSDN